MKKRLFLIATLFVCLLHSAKASSEVTRPLKLLYLGIAGYGEGMGMFGHAFFVFARSKGQMLDAQAYQYNLRLPPRKGGEEIDLREALAKSEFILDREPALDFIRKYTRQQRAVLLFPVRLEPEGVRKIYDELLRDQADREARPRNDYDVGKNNCLTKVLDLINPQLPSAGRIDTAYHEGNLSFSRVFSPSAMTANVPLAFASRLETHPFFGKPMIFKPDRYAQLKTDMAIIDKLTALTQICHWSEAKYKNLSSLLTHPDFRFKEPLIRLLSQEIEDCHNAKADDVYAYVLSLLEMVATSQSQVEMIQRYYR